MPKSEKITSNYYKNAWADFETTVNADPFYKTKLNVSRAVLQYKKEGGWPDGFKPPEVYSWNVKINLSDLVFKERKIYNGKKDYHRYIPVFSNLFNKNDRWKCYYKELLWDKHIEVSKSYFKKRKDLKDLLKKDDCYIDFVGLSIDSFCDFIWWLMINGKFKIYFHNGGNFDNHFIITQRVFAKLNKYFFSYNISKGLKSGSINQTEFLIQNDTKSKKRNGVVKTMVNKTKKIYDIQISIDDKHKVRISDNNLLFQGSIKDFGKSIADKHKLKDNSIDWDNIYNKAELDGGYQKFEKYKNWDEFLVDGNQLEYLCQDTFVLAEYQRLMDEVLPKNYWKLTAGATAYSNWEGMFSKKLLNEAIDDKTVQVIKNKNGWCTYNVFKPVFKQRLSEEKIKEILLSEYFGKKAVAWLGEKRKDGITHWEYLKTRYYYGGMSWMNENHIGKMLKNVYVFDYKSSYPARLYSNKKIPFGKVIVGDTNDKRYDYKLRKITLKKPMKIEYGYHGFIPFTRTNSNGTPLAINWLDEVDPITNAAGIYLTEVEWEHFKKLYHSKNKKIRDEECYEVVVEYCFKSKPANYFFKEYIEYWFEVKEKSKMSGDKLMESIAKLMLNSLYGKYGTNVERESNYWNNKVGDWVSYTTNTLIDGDLSYYLPFAIFTTAEARMALVDSIGDRDMMVAGGDTDSFFVILTGWTNPYDWLIEKDKMKTGKEIDNLGKADCENAKYTTNIGYGEGMDFVGRRSKQYGFFWKGKLTKFAYAGIKTNVGSELKEYDEKGYEIYDENFKRVKEILQPIDLISGKKIPNQLEGVKISNYGVLLCDTIKEITPIWSFDKRIGQFRYTKESYENDLRKDGWK